MGVENGWIESLIHQVHLHFIFYALQSTHVLDVGAANRSMSPALISSPPAILSGTDLIIGFFSS